MVDDDGGTPRVQERDQLSEEITPPEPMVHATDPARVIREAGVGIREDMDGCSVVEIEGVRDGLRVRVRHEPRIPVRHVHVDESPAPGRTVPVPDHGSYPLFTRTDSLECCSFFSAVLPLRIM
jgi:hypothetical protein